MQFIGQMKFLNKSGGTRTTSNYVKFFLKYFICYVTQIEKEQKISFDDTNEHKRTIPMREKNF